jgi:hypothetical protein
MCLPANLLKICESAKQWSGYDVKSNFSLNNFKIIRVEQLMRKSIGQISLPLQKKSE